MNEGQRRRNRARDARAGSPGADRDGRRAILWNSNSPHAGTGYGTQTAQAVVRLAADGHRVAVSSNYGLEGGVNFWRGIKQYPRGFDMHSNDVIAAHAESWAHENPGFDPLIVTLYDVFVYKGKPWDKPRQIASWVPIDHMPVPPDVESWLRRPNVVPIAMSEYGKGMIEHADIECLYVPHAIELDVFRPTPQITTPTATFTGRQFMGIGEDRFVVMMAAHNKGTTPVRKAFGENILAFAIWASQRPDAVLYLHAESKGALGGVDLPALVKACGLAEDRVVFVDQYAYRMGIPQNALAATFTAADVLLACSMGEGFGIPVIEAQACGTPVIVTNFSAQPELVGDGWLVEGQPWWNPAQRAFMRTPIIPEIVEALEGAYQRGRARSVKAQDFAADYGADVVFERFWKPAMDALSVMEMK